MRNGWTPSGSWCRDCRVARLSTGSLFPQRLERLVAAADGDAIQVPNGSDARWARDASGRTWVRKHEVDTGFQPLVAEALCHLLGLELEVRQPQAAVLQDAHGWSWMSEAIPNAAEHWSLELRDQIANLDELGRMLTLDALTGNGDRHRRNLMLVQEEDLRFTIWAIDSGNALIGWKSDYLALGLRPPSVDNHARGLPIERLRQPALDGASVAAQLPRSRIEELVAEAYGLGGDEDFDAITDALLRRCQGAPTVVTDHLDALESLR